MDITNCTLSLVDTTNIAADYSEPWIKWKRARKPLRIEVTDKADSDRPTVVARVSLSMGMIRQKPRHGWLQRIGKSVDLSRIASITKFEIAEPEFADFTKELLEVVVKLLPQIWKSRHDETLLFVEGRLGDRGLREPALSDAWILLDASGNGSAPSHAKAPSSASRLAIRAVIEGAEDQLPPYTPRPSAYRKKERPTLKSPADYTPESLADLVGRFSSVPDPREKNSNDFPKGALLAIICLARYSGAKSVREYSRWSALLSQEQRASLGLAKVKDGQVQEPSHDVLDKFIAAGRKRRQEMTASDYEFKFGSERPEDGDRRPILVEGVVKGVFNTWLEGLRGDDVERLRERLWSEFGRKSKSEAAGKPPRRKEIKLKEHWSHVSEAYADVKLPTSAHHPLTWLTDSEISELSLLLEKEFADHDPRIPMHRDCPLRAVLFLLGLGKQYVSRKGVEVWQWSHRFNDDQLYKMGLYLESAGTRPGPKYLERVIDGFEGPECDKLERCVVKWLEDGNRVASLVEDGGRLRRVKKRRYRVREKASQADDEWLNELESHKW